MNSRAGSSVSSKNWKIPVPRIQDQIRQSFTRTVYRWLPAQNSSPNLFPRVLIHAVHPIHTRISPFPSFSPGAHWQTILLATSYRGIVASECIHRDIGGSRILFLYHGWQTRVAPETLARIASYSVSPSLIHAARSCVHLGRGNRLILPWRDPCYSSRWFFKRRATVAWSVARRRGKQETERSFLATSWCLVLGSAVRIRPLRVARFKVQRLPVVTLGVPIK